MIVGIGVDIVDVPRFERSLARTPRLADRLFSPRERVLAPRSLAARYAAKEALIKALGGSDGVHWTEIEVTPEASGRPWFTLTGSTADVVAQRGITTIHLSLSHDAGLATAYVIAESLVAPLAPTAPVAPPSSVETTPSRRDHPSSTDESGWIRREEVVSTTDAGASAATEGSA